MVLVEMLQEILFRGVQMLVALSVSMVVLRMLDMEGTIA